MKTHTQVEARALKYAGAVAITATVLALSLFNGKTVPLSGQNSIGSVAAGLAAMAAGLGLLLSWRQPALQPRGRFPHLRRGVSAAALAVTYSAIGLLLTVVMFFLIQSAFTGVSLDAVTAGILAGATAAACGYASFLAGAHLTSLRLATTLAVFLVSGVMVSMVSAPNPYWWEVHFSSLGAGHSPSAAAFNLTLLVGGLVMVGLADLVASDFNRWQDRSATRKTKVNLIRVTIAGMGLALAGVGLFPYDTHLVLHNFSAGLLVVIFLGLAFSLGRIAPGFVKSFYLFSYIMAGAIIVDAWLLLGARFFNLTVAELVAAGIIFTWFVVMVRHVAAGLIDATSAAVAYVER